MLLKSDGTIGKSAKGKSAKYFRNNLKMNISALAFNNYAFSYERSLSKKTSMQLSYRYMPLTTLSLMPVSKFALDQLKEPDEDLQEILDKTNLSGQAITLDYRLFAGRKAGPKGFYASFYGRYASYKLDYVLKYSIDEQTTSFPIIEYTRDYEIPSSGTGTGIGGGILTGVQFNVAKRIVFDIYIIGAHYGKTKIKSYGAADLSSMTETERSDFEAEIEALEILGKSNVISASVTETGVEMTIKAPFVGIRGLGLSIGIAF
jgi:hypothetical protein